MYLFMMSFSSKNNNLYKYLKKEYMGVSVQK